MRGLGGPNELVLGLLLVLVLGSTYVLLVENKSDYELAMECWCVCKLEY